jgi:hypothetical protein
MEKIASKPLWEDGERVISRGSRDAGDGRRIAMLIVEPATDPPTPGALDRLGHEYGLKDELSIAWAARPFEMMRERGRTLLVLRSTGRNRHRIRTELYRGSAMRKMCAPTLAQGRSHDGGH